MEFGADTIGLAAKRTTFSWFDAETRNESVPVIGRHRFIFIDHGMIPGERVTVAMEPIGQEM